MAKRTSYNLSTWRRVSDGAIHGVPLGVLLPVEWASSVVEMLSRSTSQWEAVGSITKGTLVDDAIPPRCMAVYDGSALECTISGMTVYLPPLAVEDVSCG